MKSLFLGAYFAIIYGLLVSVTLMERKPRDPAPALPSARHAERYFGVVHAKFRASGIF